MQDLVEYMARSLVDHPEDVRVTEEGGAHSLVYELRVHPSDGSLVQGRVANAMRNLPRVVASRKRHPGVNASRRGASCRRPGRPARHHPRTHH